MYLTKTNFDLTALFENWFNEIRKKNKVLHDRDYNMFKKT